MSITHTFSSTKSDGGDATLVRPSDWNAGHSITVLECAAQCMIQANAATTNNSDSGNFGQGTGSFASKNLQQYSLSGISNVKKAWLQIVVTDFNNCLGINEGIDEFIRVERLIRTDINYAQATWNIYKTGSNWGTAGAASSSTDYTTKFSAFDGPFPTNTNIRRIQVLTGATNQMEFWDITGMVQDAIDNSFTTLDLSITCSETGGQNQLTTASRTNGTTAYRPKIVIL